MKANQDSKAPPAPAWLPYVVANLLCAYYVLTITATLNKGNGYDELPHLTAGYFYWQFNNYRLHSENGNLPQRWAALPLLVTQPAFPSLDQDLWAKSNVYGLGKEFFFRMGNPLDSMLLQGRAMIALFGVALCLLVFFYSRFLFGWQGGLVSLLLTAFCPSLLAHGGQITSDLAVTFFFLLTLTTVWWLLNDLCYHSIFASAVALASLFLSKYSAILILPILVLLTLIRVLDGRPLPTRCFGAFLLSTRRQMLTSFVAVFLLQGVFVWGMIWAAYGFTFSPFTDPESDSESFTLGGWNHVLDGNGPSETFDRALVWARTHKVLPEAYLYGLANSIRFAQSRSAFLNGETKRGAWLEYFPLAFLMKTPLPTLGILLLAASLGLVYFSTVDSLWKGFYRAAPLWLFLAIYWVVAINSQLNIGHRHILPVYPPLFILAGAAATCWRLSGRFRLAGLTLTVCLGWLVVETAVRWPHYLAYFNHMVGGPRHGYKHLVDSSLDWGQDLPGLKQWLEQAGILRADVPVYLSYFGTGDPEYYGLKTIPLPVPVQKPAQALISMYVPGTYCISATHLQGVYQKVNGPWTEDHEHDYRQTEAYLRTFRHLYASLDSDDARNKLLATPKLTDTATTYHALCFARLCNYLRGREPLAQIGYSIMIYQVTQRDLDLALEPHGD